VDTGALLLCIPEHVAVQLGLAELEKREVTTTDGTMHLAPYVWPVLMKFENQQCLTGSLMLGDEVLLGTVPMEDMDVLVSTATWRLIMKPESPNFAKAIVKAVARRFLCYWRQTSRGTWARGLGDF
jgi:clan AA aspartic protease